jgi:hypothetical protein
MAIVITKKLRTILLIVLGVLVLGGGGYLLWRVNQKETVAPEDSEAGWSQCYTTEQMGMTGEILNKDGYPSLPPYEELCPSGELVVTKGKCYRSDGRCWELCTCAGEEPPKPPDYCVPEYPDYNALPYTTTAASQKSELVLYYRVIPPYTSLAQFIIEDPDGQDHTITASSTQDRIATGIVLEAGETATVKTVYDSPGSKASVGWQSVNSGNTCGSGAMGPIQNNDCERYEKKDVSSYISWANSSTDETVISRQCWADAKEWEGDYDFEDFFVQLAYLPIIVEVPTNPDWTIEKEVEGEYVVENGENYADIDYTVVVTNIGDGEGNIDKIVDELDEKVLEDYIQNISDDGVYSSGSITWDLEGEDEIFDPNESLELTYTFQIPESAYGTYRNTVTAYPTEGDNFSDNATITLATDEEEPTTTIPQTGVFDTVIGKISLGFSFIFLGGLVSQYSKINYLLAEKQQFRSEIRKQKKATRRRKRLEDRFQKD